MKQKIILCFLIAFTLSACGKAKTNDVSQTQVPSNTEKQSFVGSLKELIGKGDSLKCILNNNDNQSQSSIIYYIDGNNQKMRADIITQTLENGVKKTTNNYTIFDKNTMYSWGDNQTNGIKFTLDTNSTQPNIDTTNTNNSEFKEEFVDMDSQINFDCQKWSVDNSVFTVPSNIKFVDMAETMKELEKFTNDVSSDMCKLCDSVPENKSECQKMYCK